MVKKLLAKSYLGVILALLYLPILLIIVFSFSGTSNFTFTSAGATLDSYTAIFSSGETPKLMEALKNTMFIAAVASVVSTILGSVSAIGIFSLKRRMKNVVNNVNQLPIINSEIVMAVSLMLFFVTVKFIPAGYWRLIVGHITFCTPYVVLSVMPKLEQMDANIYEAALDLGASPLRAMTSVLLPIMTPGIVSGFVMAFTLSMDDFIITQINKGAATGIETLSTYIYSDVRVRGMEPFWFAVFSIIFVVLIAILLFINLYNSRQDKKNTNKEQKR